MANQIPLIVNAGAAQIQELATADNLEISANIVAGGILTDGYYYANGTPVTFGGGSASLPLANGTSNFNIATADGNATVTADGGTWTFGTDGVLTLPNADATGFGNIYFEENSSTITFGLDDNSTPSLYSFSPYGMTIPSNIDLPLVAKLNSGGVGNTNAAEFGTQVTSNGTAITSSQIYMGAGTTEVRGIVDNNGAGLMYAGVEGEGFAGIVGMDPNVTSQYAIAVGSGNTILLGATTGNGNLTTTEYTAGVGALNANGTINGLLASSSNVVISNGNTAGWSFGDTGNLTLPSNIASINYANGQPYGGSGSTSAAGNAGDIQINVAGNIGADSTLRYVDTGGEMTLYADYMNTSTVFTNDILGSGNAINISAQFGNSVLFDTTGGISATGNVTAADFTTTGSNGDITMTGGNITGANVVGANTVVGNGNLHLQPDPANTGSYLDIFLTSGPDIHIAGNGENIIIGRDAGANVSVAVDGTVSIQADAGTPYTWKFDIDGNVIVPGAIRTASNSQLELTESANTAYLGTTADDSTALYLTATTAQLYANGEVSISSNVGGGNAHGWAFDVDGNTNIPGDIISFGNIAITTNVVNTASSWLFGADGTTQFPANTINTAGQLSIKSFDSLLDISSANTTVGSGGEILLNSGFTGPSSAGVQLVAYVDGTQAALKTWNFGADGNLHTPQGGYIGPADVKGQGTMLSGGTGNITSVTSYYADAPGIYSSCLTANPDGTLNISTYGNGTGLLGQWIFGDGNLTVSGNFNAATASPASSINGFDSINAITFSASGNVTANIFNLGNAGNLTYSSIQQNQNAPYGSEAYGIELLTTTDDANVFSSISAGPDYVSLKSTNAGNANVVLQGGYGITLSTSNATGGAIKNWTFTSAGSALFPGNISTTGNVTGNFFIGDGSQMTNLPAGNYSNSNVATFLDDFGSNAISTSGNITGGNVYATNIVAEASFSIQSSNFNAFVGNRYGVDTTSNPVTATLTAFPITGTAVFFADAGGAFATNNLTINPVGRTIMGSSGNMAVSTNNQSFGLFYNGTTWRTYSAG